MKSCSVIIPAYKARRFLAETLASIGEQTLQPDEVIVVDDCSPEPVDDIISGFASHAGYPPLRLLKHEVNRGQAAARNTGIQASASEWIAFLDSDDLWAPNHLESISTTLRQSGADVGFCPGILFDEDPMDPSNYCLRPLTEDEMALRPLSILNRCFIIISSSVMRRDSLAAAGGFDESPMMRGVEDLDCFMRLFHVGAKFQMSETVTLYYRKHPESATGTLGYLARQSVHVTRRHLFEVEGGTSEKLALLTQAYWRAAVQLWLVKAPDRFSWLLGALRHSLWNPLLGLRWSWRFVRALYRNSSQGL